MDHAITGTPAETILHGALELSKNSWLLALQFPDRAQPSLYPISGGDTEGLMAKLTAAGDRWAKMSGKAPSIVLCYEAGYDAFWLARFLKARGIECLVVDPASMQVNRRARRAKTDRIDVGMLLRALIAWGQAIATSGQWFAFPAWTRRTFGAPTASATAWSVKGRLTSIASRACCSVKVFAASTSRVSTRPCRSTSLSLEMGVHCRHGLPAKSLGRSRGWRLYRSRLQRSNASATERRRPVRPPRRREFS